MSLITQCEGIVQACQARKVDGVLVDMQTANVIATVGAALSPVNRAKLDAMPVDKAARICWKLVK